MWKPLPVFGRDDEGEPLAHLHVFANDEPRPLHLAGRAYTVTPGQPIPIPGKGENSWDCGDDAVFSCSGSSVEDAIGNVVEHVLSRRSRYGGEHMSVPS